MNVREAAYLSLLRCMEREKYSNLEVDAALKKYGFKGSDRALFTALVYGTIEKRIALDYVIQQFLKKPIEKIEPKILELLRLGTYQIIYLDRIPDSAACNESVEIAKLYTHKGTSGFINGVLRNISRNKDEIVYPQEGSIEYYSVKYSCPPQLCQMWMNMYGDKCAEGILRGINRNPFITLRANTLKISRDDLSKMIFDLGIQNSKTELSPYGLKLDEFVSINEITPVAEGYCIVQDEASQLCSMAVGAQMGDFIVDTCSCPGGKSFGMAMDMNNTGSILSLDLHESKLSLVKRGAEKLGITNITTGVQNGTKLREELIGKADRVLCDVPCSGLGVIAKKPDLRHKNLEEISKLPDIQYAILQNASKFVKPNGYLIYSTCTLNKEENENNIYRFLKNNPNFEPSSENMPFGKTEISFFPEQYDTDGFYIAKLKRIK